MDRSVHDSSGRGSESRFDAGQDSTQEFNLIESGRIINVSFDWDRSSRRLHCYCTCNNWTFEANCRHVSQVLAGDVRGVTGGGDIALVQDWARAKGTG